MRPERDRERERERSLSSEQTEAVSTAVIRAAAVYPVVGSNFTEIHKMENSQDNIILR